MSTFEVGDGPVSVTIGNAPGPAGSSGVVTVSAPLTNSGTSSAAILGLSIGSGLSIVGGALTAAAGGYTLPAASSTVLGGIKIGSGLAIDGNGVVTAAGNYTLPAATTSTLGGVIVGAGLSVTSGTVSAAVVSVASRTGAVTLDKADVGLGSVDNTADTSKPVSTAQGAADAAVQAYAIQRANHTGTQAVGTITGLAAVATSGAYSDLSGKPTVPTITSGTAAPTGGSSGDIYLRYSA